MLAFDWLRTPTSPARSRTWLPLAALRAFAAAALGVDAYVHATNAAFYDPSGGGVITEGNLFRAEAVVAVLVALGVLLRPTLVSWAASFAVSASALGAVVLYRYVDVGAWGPIPDLYEPTWRSPGKLLSAYAEAAAVAVTAAGLLMTLIHTRRITSSARRSTP